MATMNYEIQRVENTSGLLMNEALEGGLDLFLNMKFSKKDEKNSSVLLPPSIDKQLQPLLALKLGKCISKINVRAGGLSQSNKAKIDKLAAKLARAAEGGKSSDNDKKKDMTKASSKVTADGKIEIVDKEEDNFDFELDPDDPLAQFQDKDDDDNDGENALDAEMGLEDLEEDELMSRKNVTLKEFESHIKNESGCSFYSDNSPQDLVNLYPHLQKLLERVDELLGDYDEHPALVSVKDSIGRIFKLNLFSTPAIHVYIF